MNTTTETKEQTTVTLKKWQPAAGLGPRMAKQFNEAASKVKWAAQSRRTLRGVIGRPETEKLDDYNHTVLCGGQFHAEYVTRMNAIHEKHGGTLSPANYKEIVADLMELAAHFNANPTINDERITIEEHEKREAASKQYEEKENVRRAEQEARKIDLETKVLAKKPAWAGALVVAYYEEDACDPQTDYFATTRKRALILGFRSGSREDFKQLRALAAKQPETADLDCDEAEHRDNYSMGRGNYLKLAGRYSTGWYVKSVPFTGYSFDSITHFPFEVRIPEQSEPTATAAPTTGANGITVSLNAEKQGVEIRFPSKPAPEVLERVKANGFRWSRFSGCWYAKDLPSKRAFAYELAGQAQPTAQAAKTEEPEQVRDPGEDAADRWAELEMQGQHA